MVDFNLKRLENSSTGSKLINTEKMMPSDGCLQSSRRLGCVKTPRK